MGPNNYEEPLLERFRGRDTGNENFAADFFDTQRESPQTHMWNPQPDGRESGVDTLLRYERAGTELANERTFLAWLRTVLSCFGLAFHFVDFKGKTDAAAVRCHENLRLQHILMLAL